MPSDCHRNEQKRSKQLHNKGCGSRGMLLRNESYAGILALSVPGISECVSRGWKSLRIKTRQMIEEITGGISVSKRLLVRVKRIVSHWTPPLLFLLRIAIISVCRDRVAAKYLAFSLLILDPNVITRWWKGKIIDRHLSFSLVSRLMLLQALVSPLTVC